MGKDLKTEDIESLTDVSELVITKKIGMGGEQTRPREIEV